MNRNQRAWAAAGAINRAGLESVKRVLRELLEASTAPAAHIPCAHPMPAAPSANQCERCLARSRLILAANAARNVLKDPQ